MARKYTYNLPFQTFNPWMTANTPEDNPAFNYTQDPYYNKQQDLQTWDLAQVGAGGDSNRGRVARWMKEGLAAAGYTNPGGAPVAAAQKAYLDAIARLHEDYDNNKFDWNRSGFTGYDKFLAPKTTIGDPASGGPGPKLPPNVVNPPGSKGPGSVVIPGGPRLDPNVNPDGTTGTPNPAVGGGLGSAAGHDVLNSDPNLAYQYMIRQLGWDPTKPSRFGDYLEKRFSPLLQANLAASQVGNNSNYLDQIENTINQFGQGFSAPGGNFFAGQRQLAENTLQSPDALGFLGGIKDQSQVQQYLNQLQTLKYAGANPMIQQSIADTIERAQQQYDWESLQQVQAGTGQGDPWLEWLRANPGYNKYIGIR